MKNKNNAFIESTMALNTFKNAKVNLIPFFDKQGILKINEAFIILSSSPILTTKGEDAYEHLQKENEIYIATTKDSMQGFTLIRDRAGLSILKFLQYISDQLKRSIRDSDIAA
ncbi:MAG: hypothetical protein A3F14_02090 [Gammaproteobacteria bacterium RIFCSPHIGHO2_12_FULL_43_28]|nr:MAG: hypothetical protein A3F14_02090 [Gammaproteobacteria bacterium RIFCSPHIGHO2_12_FULL_43_28]